MKVIGEYRLVEKIGEGNYGEIFRGLNSSTGETIAVKTLMKSPDDNSRRPKSEILILESIVHPNITKLHNVIETTNHFYMILEYCSGGDLKNFLEVHGRASEFLAKKWLRQLLEACIHLKNQGIMHRDIKLANVILTETYDVKLADFGFARVIGDIKDKYSKLGTMLYMAPELLNCEVYDYSADVWSFGILAYEIMVGEPPFRMESLRKFRRAQQEAIKFPDGMLSSQAMDFLRGIIVHNPSHRPSYEDILNSPFLNNFCMDDLSSIHEDICRQKESLDHMANLVTYYQQIDEIAGVAFAYYCYFKSNYILSRAILMRDLGYPKEQLLGLYESVDDSASRSSAMYRSSIVATRDDSYQAMGERLLEIVRAYNNSLSLQDYRNLLEVLLLLIPQSQEVQTILDNYQQAVKQMI